MDCCFESSGSKVFFYSAQTIKLVVGCHACRCYMGFQRKIRTALWSEISGLWMSMSETKESSDLVITRSRMWPSWSVLPTTCWVKLKDSNIVWYWLANPLPTIHQQLWEKVNLWSFFQLWNNVGIRLVIQCWLANQFPTVGPMLANHCQCWRPLPTLAQHRIAIWAYIKLQTIWISFSKWILLR